MNRDTEERSDTAGPEEGQSLVRHEEEVAGVAKAWREKGSIRARKRVERVAVRRSVPVDVEQVDVDYVGAEDGDSGEIETLPDGSISIPVYEEELVITRRPVLRERVVIRKGIATERVTVTDRLRRERVEIDADDGLEKWVDVEPEDRTRSRTEPETRGQHIIHADDSDSERPLFDYDRGGETKPSFLTSELLVLICALAAIVVATWLADALDAAEAWILIAVLGAAYMLARGFAKADNPEPSRR